MATKKQKLDNDEHVGLWVMRAFVAVLAFLFFKFGFFDDGTPEIGDESSLYDALHPMAWYNLVGVILWTSVMVWFSLLFRTKIGDLFVPAGSTWPNLVVFGVGALGIPLMFA
jgi:hypothetical protein